MEMLKGQSKLDSATKERVLQRRSAEKICREGHVSVLYEKQDETRQDRKSGAEQSTADQCREGNKIGTAVNMQLIQTKCQT